MVENRMIERSFYFFLEMCYDYFQQDLMKDGDGVSKVNDLKKENRKKIRECLLMKYQLIRG